MKKIFVVAASATFSIVQANPDYPLFGDAFHAENGILTLSHQGNAFYEGDGTPPPSRPWEVLPSASSDRIYDNEQDASYLEDLEEDTEDDNFHSENGLLMLRRGAERTRNLQYIHDILAGRVGQFTFYIPPPELITAISVPHDVRFDQSSLNINFFEGPDRLKSLAPFIAYAQIHGIADLGAAGLGYSKTDFLFNENAGTSDPFSSTPFKKLRPGKEPGREVTAGGLEFIQDAILEVEKENCEPDCEKTIEEPDTPELEKAIVEGADGSLAGSGLSTAELLTQYRSSLASLNQRAQPVADHEWNLDEDHTSDASGDPYDKAHDETPVEHTPGANRRFHQIAAGDVIGQLGSTTEAQVIITPPAGPNIGEPTQFVSNALGANNLTSVEDHRKIGLGKKIKLVLTGVAHGIASAAHNIAKLFRRT